MKLKSELYNSTKKRALEVLKDRTWMDVPTFAHKVGIQPVRRTYAYLDHLQRQGLVIRGWYAPGKLYFQITERGLERLEWLRRQNRTALQVLIEPILRAK
jgi:hypothetical protein